MEMKPIESEDIGCNPSSNASFEEVLESVSRRRLLQSGLGTLALGFLAGPRSLLAGTAAVGFSSISVSQEDGIRVPPGYVSEVLYAWGDPVSAGPAWDPTGANTPEEQAVQAGMHHDGIHFFPLPYGSGSSTRGLLVMNHEYTDDGLLHVGGFDNWSPDKVLKSQAAHGVSVIEVAFDNGRWSVVRPSSYGRRITAFTPIAISGPAAGHPLLKTSTDPTGTVVKGTVNNCANGYTPWGTYLTCEENFNGYFVNGGTIPPLQARYGISAAGAGYRWHEHDGRFDARAHPNEPNRFGWVVEIDPFNPGSTPVKRTALGRFKHENAAFALARDGRAVFYMGDDERFEYVYKFVSRDPAPTSGGLSASVLDNGTLYAARFNADGTGNWIALTQGSNGLDAAAGFPDQATVLINARGAADKVGATKMDRPEWITVNPANRDCYATLTNNSQRGDAGRAAPDAANPRKTNVFGHIIRWRDDGDTTASTFRWSVFCLCGDPANNDATKKGNVKGASFGSPDGLWFDPNGILWIQTDVSTSTLNTGDYVNLGNNQMLAADPATAQIKRFLTGPRGCEITGVIATPDMRSMFVNIQHPGEPSSERNDPRSPAAVSSWPDGPGIGRPRAATIVIRREDGGVIGT
jgi:secreted PhoX family phosphatase